MPPAARVGNLHTHPTDSGDPPDSPPCGPILPPGSSTVLIGGMPAARVGDKAACIGPPDTVVAGSPTVFIGGQPAARKGDPTAYGGLLMDGFPTVLIGDLGIAAPGGTVVAAPAVPPAPEVLTRAADAPVPPVPQPCPGPVAPQVDPLKTARTLGGTTYKTYTYGTEPGKQVDCTKFVLEVIKKVAAERGVELSTKTKHQISLHPRPEDLQSRVTNDDPWIQGVQKALVDAKLGEPIDISQASPGDIVQYWNTKEDGTWGGHAAIIEQIKDGEVSLYGSHKSLGRVGTRSVPLTDMKKVFVVRWTK